MNNSSAVPLSIRREIDEARKLEDKELQTIKSKLAKETERCRVMLERARRTLNQDPDELCEELIREREKQIQLRRISRIHSMYDCAFLVSAFGSWPAAILGYALFGSDVAGIVMSIGFVGTCFFGAMSESFG